MWRASSGTRVLTESEWALFEIGLDELRMMIEEDISYETDDTDTGVSVFDRLTPEQKLCQLAEVGLAFRDETFPEPKLTAVSEGTVMAVFKIKQQTFCKFLGPSVSAISIKLSGISCRFPSHH